MLQVPIPPEFESFAREQVAAGHAASEEEAVARVLRDYLDEVARLRALIDPALASADRGETVDGETFLRDLLVETQVMGRAPKRDR